MELRGQDTTHTLTKPVYAHASFVYDFPKSYGASAGIDLVLKSRVKIYLRENKPPKKIYSDWILNGDIGFYRYVMNHTGLFVFSSIGKRFHPNRPVYVEVLLQANLLRTFYDGKVYEVDNNQVKERKNFGRFYGGLGFGTTISWNLQKSYPEAPPIILQCQPSLWFQIPYNSFVLPHLSVQTTLKYPLRNLFTRVQLKEKIKK